MLTNNYVLNNKFSSYVYNIIFPRSFKIKLYIDEILINQTKCNRHQKYTTKREKKNINKINKQL